MSTTDKTALVTQATLTVVTAAVGGAATAGEATSAAATPAPVYGFYSGPGAQSAAETWAAGNNGILMGATEFGQAVDNGTMTIAQGCEAYANSASGAVQMFSNDPLAINDSAWFTTELPTLANNPNVTNIVFNPVPKQ
jgi:hypothetical protein